MKKMLVLMMVLLAVSGCKDDDSITEVETPETTSNVTTIDNGDGSFSTVINAGMYDAVDWVYFSFADGEVSVSAPETATNWDMRFMFYNIQINGGSNGSSGVEIAYEDDVLFADISSPAVGGYVTDADGSDAFETDGGWYVYNPVSHDTALNGRVWFVHLPDDTYLKLELDHLVDDAGTPGYPGFKWEFF